MKDVFDAFYIVTVEIPTPPLLLTETFYVKGASDVERIREMGAEIGYSVVSARVVHREDSGFVIDKIKRIKAELA